jgi:hypothetical protein
MYASPRGWFPVLIAVLGKRMVNKSLILTIMPQYTADVRGCVPGRGAAFSPKLGIPRARGSGLCFAKNAGRFACDSKISGRWPGCFCTRQHRPNVCVNATAARWPALAGLLTLVPGKTRAVWVAGPSKNPRVTRPELRVISFSASLAGRDWTCFEGYDRTWNISFGHAGSPHMSVPLESFSSSVANETCNL